MKYEKIAPKKRGLGKWYTLWLGEDHLLSVQCTGYTEDYSRYYFKDIQAIVSQRSSRGKVINAVCGALSALALLAGANGSDGLHFAADLFGGLFLLLLLWNVALGPTCICRVRTSLGLELLPALGRVRSVKKLLEKVVPLIRALQGEIASDEIVALARLAKDAPAASSSTVAAADSARATEGATVPHHGRLHRVAFLMLMVESGLSLLQFAHNSRTLILLSALACLGFLLLAVAALAKQKVQAITPAVRWLTWGGVATMMAGGTVTYFFTVFLNIARFKDLGKAGNMQREFLDMYAAIQPAEHRSFAFFVLAYALVCGVIGIAAMIALSGDRPGVGRFRP